MKHENGEYREKYVGWRHFVKAVIWDPFRPPVEVFHGDLLLWDDSLLNS